MSAAQWAARVLGGLVLATAALSAWHQATGHQKWTPVVSWTTPGSHPTLVALLWLASILAAAAVLVTRRPGWGAVALLLVVAVAQVVRGLVWRVDLRQLTTNRLLKAESLATPFGLAGLAALTAGLLVRSLGQGEAEPVALQAEEAAERVAAE